MRRINKKKLLVDHNLLQLFIDAHFAAIFQNLNFLIVPSQAQKVRQFSLSTKLIDYSNVNNLSQVILRVTDEQIERDKI